MVTVTIAQTEIADRRSQRKSDEVDTLYAELRGGAAFVPTYIRQKIDRRRNLCFSILDSFILPDCTLV